MTKFWSWFFRGSGAGPGIVRFLDRWLLVHIAAGVALALVVPIPLQDAATSLLLPVAGIFIGLSFAWGGNAQALLQSGEVETLSSFKEGGYEEYVYTFQAAILIILITLVLWAIAGLGVFDCVWPVRESVLEYGVIAGTLYFFSSLTLRECWHVVLGAQSLLLARFRIRQADIKR